MHYYYYFLCRDEAEVDKYIKEGLGFPVTLKFWQDFLPYLQLLKALRPSPLGAFS